MKSKDALKLMPGDKVLFYKGPIDEPSSVLSSLYWKNVKTDLYSGLEYVVSSIIGISRHNIVRFVHSTRKKIDSLLDEKDPITTVAIELEIVENVFSPSLIERKRKNVIEKTTLTIEDMLYINEQEIMDQRELLMEMVDKSCKNNLYNLPLEKYFWYLDAEIKNAKKNTIEEYEKEYEEDMEIAKENNEQMPYRFLEGFKFFLENKREKEVFFEGVRNICEILANKYSLRTYGDVIMRFANNGVKIEDINLFYKEGWLGKKEFQHAIAWGYAQQFSDNQFRKYQW